MKQKAEELKKAFAELNDDAKESIGKLEALIKKNAMTPDQVQLIADYCMDAADRAHPELATIEGMTSVEYAELYKKMSDELVAEPEKIEEHAKELGMSAEDLAFLFAQIDGTVKNNPEVWESKEAAEMLHPKNLSILLDVFKKDE